jgi:hypothetical protein
MKHSLVFVVIMAVVILMTALSGCTSTSSPPVVPVETTTAVTYTPLPTPTGTPLATATPGPQPDAAAIADKQFVDAIEACYAENPSIANVSAQLAFISCTQNTPDPAGMCARNYKSNILRFTKDDDTSAGYLRENTRIQQARDAYSRNLSYNYLTDKAEACGPVPMNLPV